MGLIESFPKTRRRAFPPADQMLCIFTACYDCYDMFCLAPASLSSASLSFALPCVQHTISRPRRLTWDSIETKKYVDLKGLGE